MSDAQASPELDPAVDIAAPLLDGLADGLSKLSGAVDNAKIAARLNHMAKDLPKHLKTGDVDKILAGLEGVGAISAAIGVAAAVFSLVMTFSGGKSETEMILEKIAELDAKVNRLRKHLDSRFDQLGEQGDANTAILLIKPHLDELNAMGDQVAKFVTRVFELHPLPASEAKSGDAESDAVTKAPPEPRGPAVIQNDLDAAIEDLRAIDVGRIDAEVSMIANSFRSQQPNLNVLEGAFRHTSGDLREIERWGKTILSTLLWAQFSTGVIQGLQYMAGDRQHLQTLKASEDFYKPKYELVTKELTRQFNKEDPGIKQRLEREIGLVALTGGLHSGYSAAAETLNTALAEVWPQYDFLTLVYYPRERREIDAHGWTANGTVKHHFIQSANFRDGGANVLVAYAPRATPRGSTEVEANEIDLMDIFGVVRPVEEAAAAVPGLVSVYDERQVTDLVNALAPGADSKLPGLRTPGSHVQGWEPYKRNESWVFDEFAENYLKHLKTYYYPKKDGLGDLGPESCFLWLLRRGEPHYFAFATTADDRVLFIRDVPTLDGVMRGMDDQGNVRSFQGRAASAVARWNGVYFR